MIEKIDTPEVYINYLTTLGRKHIMYEAQPEYLDQVCNLNLKKECYFYFQYLLGLLAAIASGQFLISMNPNHKNFKIQKCINIIFWFTINFQLSKVLNVVY